MYRTSMGICAWNVHGNVDSFQSFIPDINDTKRSKTDNIKYNLFLYFWQVHNYSEMKVQPMRRRS